MYLKALEIQGFKSFPEKVRLSFEKDVTAIVGPNGSGKSNISDALSWVMGEQRSKALRGSKMEDVIFGGAEQRGQLGFAQVSLILDNSKGLFDVDSTELMITRRYYRSGESEYFINKNSVRLKDVNEILMDTGLGRDGYSIIGQGKVDEILSAKSEDRREIFEEAAGISKYRYRKEESERKLLKTEENLLRVNDKIAELELQVGPLKAQAETAKKYLILRDELRDLEISLWMETLDKLQSQSSKLKDNYEQVGHELDLKKQQLELLYENTGRYSDMIRDKDIESESIRTEISSLEAKISECDNDMAVFRADLRNNEESMNRFKLELEERNNRDLNLRNQISQKRARIQEIESEISQLTEKYSSLQLENEQTSGFADQREREINQLLTSAAECENEAAAATAKYEALSRSIAEIIASSDSNKSELNKLLNRLNEEQNAYNEKVSKLNELRDAAQSIQNVLKGYEIRTEGRRKKVSELSEQKQKAQMEHNSLKSRISLLEAMEKDYEGFSKAVKLVMQESHKGVLKNIHGTVAELIKTDDKYTIAIETALGASMQSIVCDREEDGKSAIMMLKRRDGGRATFLPLSAIKGSELYERGILDEDGVEGIAVKLVKFDSKYNGIFLNLLGRTLIVDTMDSAIRLSRKYSSRFRMVTLDGQVINSGGSMTGGSAASNVGILSRANEIIRLSEQEKALDDEIKRLSIKYNEAERELNSAVYELETAGAEYRAIQDEIIKSESEMSQRKILIESIESSCLSYKQAASEIVERISKTKNDLNAAESEALEHRKKAEELRNKATHISLGQNDLKEKLDKLNDRLSSLKQEEASLNAEKEATYAAINDWEKLLNEFALENEQKVASSEALKMQNDILLNEISKKELKSAELKAHLESVKVKLSSTINEKLDIEKRRTEDEKKSQEMSREIMELEREYSRLEQKKLTADLEEKQIIDRLWDTYELSRSAAQRIRLELDNISKAQKRTVELKKEIGKLGTPNLGAIEEFDRINGRYTYLTEQRDDIQKAKTELERIIKDITNEMQTIFAREFNIINESFKETFTELFGGGRAELVLEDENDILNCGVEIKVQPPGKTQRTLTLLSGGERAFVAIALHFAILKVRPTPFCILDEIETALDEKNVERFAKYMRKMAGKTQFLVITHRRGTMEEADVLYGVTMQHGVSKVLSIDLEEALA